MSTRDLDTLDYLHQMKAALDGLNGAEIHHGSGTTVVRGGRDRDIEDLTDRVAHELGKRLKREGLL